MESEQLERLKYPIGRFQTPSDYGEAARKNWMDVIKRFPEELKAEITLLPEELWDHTYRPKGWTLRQVVHHVADSHLNAYVRFKWALTEEEPDIKDYHEDHWVNTPEIPHTHPQVSVTLLEAVHDRWDHVNQHLKEEHWQRKFYHPVNQREHILGRYLALYAWHGIHHLNHIKLVRLRES